MQHHDVSRQKPIVVVTANPSLAKILPHFFLVTCEPIMSRKGAKWGRRVGRIRTGWYSSPTDPYGCSDGKVFHYWHHPSVAFMPASKAYLAKIPVSPVWRSLAINATSSKSAANPTKSAVHGFPPRLEMLRRTFSTTLYMSNCSRLRRSTLGGMIQVSGRIIISNTHGKSCLNHERLDGSAPEKQTTIWHYASSVFVRHWIPKATATFSA